MKHSKLTYYLLTILCMMVTSCVTDGVLDECPKGKSQDMITDAHISLILNFAINNATTRAGEIDGSISEGEADERKIEDVHIYTFQNDKFKEEVKQTLISGVDGDKTRTIRGILTGSYDPTIPVKFIVVVNGENKKAIKSNTPQLDSNTTPAALYNQLVFDYHATDNWSSYIPMSGECEISPLQEGDYNTAKLELTRAIAKVNVTVNEGQGIDNFQITEIKLCNYNTKGYCTSSKTDGPNIPSGTTQSKSPISSGTLNGTEGNAYENHFYIPEHKNIGVDEKQKVYLEIKATINGIAKDYTLAFTQNDTPHNVLRNYLYVFNIRSVKMEVNVEPTLEYEVKVWEEATVDIPSFN